MKFERLLSLATSGLVWLAIIFVSTGMSGVQTGVKPDASRDNPTTVTGILLVSDWRCDEWPGNVPRDKWMCPEGASQWGLLTATKQYVVYGRTEELKQYERRRVEVTGVVSPGKEPYLPRLDVHSIGPSDVTLSEIRVLIGRLREEPWVQRENVSNPQSWDFNFTPVMLQILQIGPPAQDPLLQNLDDPQIRDRVVILLGGVGDARAVDPIIRAMADRIEMLYSEHARQFNLAASIALTNITVADVIWHHGGGLVHDACPEDPQSCWYAWWIEHRDTFDIKKTANRNYSNYPSYGIYQSPNRFRGW